MFLPCTNSSPWQMQAAKNLICCYVNLCFLQIWYRKSPPGIKSIIKYKVYLSWNACLMFTKNLCFKNVNSFLSFLTDSILFLVMMLKIKIIVHCFWHLFHCIKNAGFLLKDLVNPAKSTLTNHVNVFVHVFVGFAHCWYFKLLIDQVWKRYFFTAHQQINGVTVS